MTPLPQARGGEIIGASLAQAGQSIGQGIEKFAAGKKQAEEKQNQAKGLRMKLRGFGDAYGMEEKEWNDQLDNLGLHELQGLGENLIIKQAAQLHNAKLTETEWDIRQKEQGMQLAEKQNMREEKNLQRMEKATDATIRYQDAQAQAELAEHQQKILDEQKRGGLNEEQAKLSNDLFTKLRSSEPVKQLAALNSQYSALENLIMSKDKLEGPGDIAIVFTFMKSLDPRSVVRESEFEVAAKAGGLPEQFVNQYTKLKDGSFLTPEMRRNFLKAARQAAGSYVNSANIERQAYVDQGGRFGLPEDYAAGSPFQLSRKSFDSEEDVLEAQKDGQLKVGDQIWIFQPSGKYRKAEIK